MIALLSLLAGCGGEAKPVDTAPDLSVCDGGPSHVMIFNTLGFVRQEGATSEGFDLDGHVSDDGDEEGCYHEDLVSPGGVEGIDNAFAGLLPVLETTEARIVETLIQQSVNRGDILLAMELEDVDSFENDGCVNVALVQAAGPVLLGTDGSILPGQTFERDPSIPVTRIEGATIEDGVLRIRGLDFRLLVSVIGTEVDLTLEKGSFDVRLHEDGTAEGILGGGLRVARLDAFIDTIATDIRDLAKTLVHQAADMEPGVNAEGEVECATMSATMRFTTTTGFFFEDAAHSGTP
jgi:hypothetical protein